MGITVIKFPKLPNIEPPAQLMYELGNFVVLGIETRTAAGEDKHNRRFKKYTKPYERVRKKRGRSTRVVNLEMEGNMLGNMTAKVEGGRVTVYFPDAHEAKKARGIMNEREFFGMSKHDKERIMKKIQAFVRSKIGR